RHRRYFLQQCGKHFVRSRGSDLFVLTTGKEAGEIADTQIALLGLYLELYATIPQNPVFFGKIFVERGLFEFPDRRTLFDP
ncbi:MAG: hypothetical protein KAQ78_01620, partial [Candidatus Latescibacteria bacterium]|nr:hypothetical protein [Candidatus Latescibacterota bacterium]